MTVPAAKFPPASEIDSWESCDGSVELKSFLQFTHKIKTRKYPIPRMIDKCDKSFIKDFFYSLKYCWLKIEILWVVTKCYPKVQSVLSFLEHNEQNKNMSERKKVRGY